MRETTKRLGVEDNEGKRLKKTGPLSPTHYKFFNTKHLLSQPRRTHYKLSSILEKQPKKKIKKKKTKTKKMKKK